MTTILLIVIYLVFISLGLPDSLIGTAWPAISTSLNIDESFQGFITSAVSLCTIISFFCLYNKKDKDKWYISSFNFFNSVRLNLIYFNA